MAIFIGLPGTDLDTSIILELLLIATPFTLTTVSI